MLARVAAMSSSSKPPLERLKLSNEDVAREAAADVAGAVVETRGEEAERVTAADDDPWVEGACQIAEEEA